MKGSRKAQRGARHLFRLCVVNGRLDDGRVRLVANRLASSRRRHALPILAAFQRLVRLEVGRHTAIIESATPVAGGLRDTIRADLARRYGPGITASFREDPALIAGMRIKVGSDVYDGSVRARLAALQARL